MTETTLHHSSRRRFKTELATLRGRVAPPQHGHSQPSPHRSPGGRRVTRPLPHPRALRSRWPGCRGADTGTRLKVTDCRRQSCALSWDHPPLAVRWGRRNVSQDLGCITLDLRAERDLTHGMQCFQSLRKVWAHDWTSKHHSQNDPLPKTPRPLLSSRRSRGAMAPGCKGGHCLHSNCHTDPWGWGQHLPADNASGAEGQLTPILPWEFPESSLNLGKLIHMPSGGPAKYMQVRDAALDEGWTHQLTTVGLLPQLRLYVN